MHPDPCWDDDYAAHVAHVRELNTAIDQLTRALRVEELRSALFRSALPPEALLALESFLAAEAAKL